ncbi:MAG: hypothetical protein H7Y28_06460 [Rhodoferax sp.]|nr:hypothetical protein [Rhodoferax sp.]
MNKAIRHMLTCALLACTVGAHAQALFTFNIPVDVQEMPAAYTSIKIACRLQGLNPYTGKKETVANSTTFSSIPLVGGKAKTTVSITIDKKALPPEYQANPAGVTDGDCNFFFLTANSGTGYEPGYGQAAIKPGTPYLRQASVNFAAMRGKN